MLKNADNIVLVALATWKDQIDTQGRLAEALHLSPSGMTRSLNRLAEAQLINRNSFAVIKPHAEEYLLFGLQYVFPARLGTRVRGIASAYSAKPLCDEFPNAEMVVWAAEFGRDSGLEVPPLHPSVPALCTAFPEFYGTFSLIDAIRVGKARERKVARALLKQWIRDA